MSVYYLLLLLNAIDAADRNDDLSIKIHHLSMRKNVYFSSCLIAGSIAYAMTFERLIAARTLRSEKRFISTPMSTLARELPAQ